MRFLNGTVLKLGTVFYHAARLRSHKTVRICNAKCSVFSGLDLEALIVHKLKMHENEKYNIAQIAVQSVCTVTQTCNYMHHYLMR